MTGSSVRALTRLARRDVVRYRGRSLLVVLLVALPVAAMVAGIAIYRTIQPTQEREDVARMGRADLMAQAVSEAELRAYLPAGSIVEPLAYADGRLVIPGAKPEIGVRGLVLDGQAQGMLTLIEGRSPRGAREAAITQPVAELAGVDVGGTLTLDGSPPMVVVGLVENPMYLGERTLVVDPYALDPASVSVGTWLIGLPEGVDPEVVVAATIDPETGSQSVLIQSRESGRLGAFGESTSATILVLGTLALVEAALVASAAFAVSIRRRQRELGLLAAVGATPRQLAGTVVAEAVILGLVGCLAGVALGLIGALALTPWLDELTQRRNPPLVVEALGLFAPAAIGFVAALIAAVIPARTVARVPVLLSLSGRRPPQAPARQTLWFGLAAVGLSVAMTLGGANLSRDGDGTMSLLLMIGGAVLGTLGFGASAPWLLERLENLAVRLPLAGRIAVRDTARARSRSSPIVTAVLASFAATVALGAFTASRDAENLASWKPALYPDQLMVNGDGALAAWGRLMDEPGVIRGAQVIDLYPRDPTTLIEYRFPGARDAQGREINLVANCSNCGPGAFEPYQVTDVSAATPELLALAHAEAATEPLRQGRAVLLTDSVMTASSMEILVYGDLNSIEPTGRLTLPVTVILVGVPGGILPAAFLPAAAIQALDLVPGGEGGLEAEPYVLQYDHPVTDADVARAREIASDYASTFADTFSAPVRPGAEFRLVIIALAMLFAVSVTGIAIALGEAESRPEQRSLLALGADPRLRRRIVAARAAVLALLAGALAVPAGLLPVWGLLASRDLPLVVPSLEVAGALVALPVLAVLGAWLLSRPIPDWAAFRSVGAGQ